MVIIPCFNEAGVIGRVIDQVAAAKLGDSFEVLVVDDGSRDGTAAEAREAGARVLPLLRNLGYGYALQAGYRVALEEGVDVLVQLDGDGQHDPNSIPSLVAPVLANEADVVIGSRALSEVHYPMPLARRLGQRLFAGLLRLLCGLEIADPTSGFQALHRRAFRLYLEEDFPGDYPDTNVLLYLHLHGLRIVERPATFRTNDRGKSMHSGILKPLYYIYKMTLSMLLIYSRHGGGTARSGKDSSRNDPE